MTFTLGQVVSPLRLAVLISGGGTTLENLIKKIAARKLDAKIDLVISSTAKARGLEIAKAAGIPTLVVSPKEFASPDDFQHRSVRTLPAGRRAFGRHGGLFEVRASAERF